MNPDPPPSSRPHVPNQWLGVASQLLVGLAILLGAAAWLHPDVNGSDLWWHLASGRQIWEHGEIPLTDPFSHTAAGRPWTNHEWLWDLLAWSAYQTHPDLTAWLNLGLLVALFALVAWNAWRASRSWLVAGAVTWLAAAASHWFLDVRPHLVTLLFTALLMATLEWRRAPWLWPPLMALWANLHGGFVFGIGLLGLHVLLRSAGPLLRRDRAAFPRAEWIGLVCAGLAVGLNPWGLSIYALPLQTLDRETPFRALIEWRAPALHLDPRTYAGRFGWMGIASLIGVVRARRAPFAVALAAVTALMTLLARRFVPLFAVSAAPLAALGLGAVLDLVCRRLPVVPGAWPRLVASTVALLGALLLWQDVRFLPRPLQRWTYGEWYPAAAVAYLASMRDPPRRLFNAYQWGGYVMLHAPHVPIFIDGRAGTVYDDDVARDYIALMENEPGWRERLEARGVDAVLVETGARLAVALRSQSPAWRVAHVDPRSVLLFPPADAAHARLPPPRSLLPDGAELWLGQGFRSRMQGDLVRASEHLRAVLRADPMQLFAYGELMIVSALREDSPGVEHWLGEAQRVYPRRRDQIWAFAETAWRIMGKREAQLDALRKLLPRGPFVEDEVYDEVRRRIRELEAGAPPLPESDPSRSD